jgi:hypothetical protein
LPEVLRCRRPGLRPRIGAAPAKTRPNGAAISVTFSPPAIKLTRGHHAALTFGDLPALVAALREVDTVAALALEFAILAAAQFLVYLVAVSESVEQAF